MPPLLLFFSPFGPQAVGARVRSPGSSAGLLLFSGKFLVKADEVTNFKRTTPSLITVFIFVLRLAVTSFIFSDVSPPFQSQTRLVRSMLVTRLIPPRSVLALSPAPRTFTKLPSPPVCMYRARAFPCRRVFPSTGGKSFP